ncbi:MAG: translation initiation factor IF-2 associated domain-containing protein, partial [Pseudomonadota bacterium]
MSDENDNGRTPPRPSLTLKPRAGSVSAGVVKQSFSHGRSKTVVVETKRVRTHVPGGATNLAGPSAHEKRSTYEPARPASPRPASSGPVDPSGNLSAEEMRARQRAIDAAREAQERQAAQAAEAARKLAAEQAAARAAAQPAAPAPQVQAPAAPVAAAPTPTPAPAAPA